MQAFTSSAILLQRPTRSILRMFDSHHQAVGNNRGFNIGLGRQKSGRLCMQVKSVTPFNQKCVQNATPPNKANGDKVSGRLNTYCSGRGIQCTRLVCVSLLKSYNKTSENASKYSYVASKERLNCDQSPCAQRWGNWIHIEVSQYVNGQNDYRATY